MYNKNDIQCGAINLCGDISPIYCNPETGECYFPDPLMGDARLISEVSIDVPQEVAMDIAAADIFSQTYGECIGLVYSAEGVLKILDEEHAILVSADPTEPSGGSAMAIDLNADYDPEN